MAVQWRSTVGLTPSRRDRNRNFATPTACKVRALTYPTDEMRMALTWNMENLALSTCARSHTGCE